ncbi:hypothetical protein ACQWKP_23885, partial [Salmonella enterica subsp. enterica serovar Infantis]
APAGIKPRGFILIAQGGRVPRPSREKTEKKITNHKNHNFYPPHPGKTQKKKKHREKNPILPPPTGIKPTLNKQDRRDTSF